ncbi:MAG: 3-deoxy-D-manno-octulosonic acid transferase [Synergistaceae bacterium]|jgi:3-deoxy-D-manno-octulosonic-acid transferase|nr:3-deoxy-D-manno-octulosonic acid transferase [Synergistaceae bacterium]
MTLPITIYRAAIKRIYPMMEGHLRKKYPDGFDERRGIYAPHKLEALSGGRTLWLHAVSVGEVRAASSVASAAANSGRGVSVVVSTMTKTGAAAASDLMSGGYEAHIYAPWDVPAIVSRACEALRPSAFAALETELWPNLLYELRSRGVPRFLVNARVSDKRVRRAAYMGGTLRELYGIFDMILARSDEDGRRLRAIGVDAGKIHVTGDSKIDSILERRNTVSRELPGLASRLSLGDGPLFVAGSTRSGEDEVILRAFASIKDDPLITDARLVIAPRHPERAKSVADMASKFGSTAFFSQLPGEGGRGERADIVIVDVIGVLYALYGLAASAFIGGSLVSKGGQNILEPASWGVPMLHGPHMDDFAAPASEFAASGASHIVRNADEIASLWRLAALGELEAASACAKYFRDRAGGAAEAWEYMEKYL